MTNQPIRDRSRSCKRTVAGQYPSRAVVVRVGNTADCREDSRTEIGAEVMTSPVDLCNVSRDVAPRISLAEFSTSVSDCGIVGAGRYARSVVPVAEGLQQLPNL